MTNRLPVIRFSNELRRLVQQWRRRGNKIALVPTMGGLHDGHMALVRLAKQHADRIVVSVFVNPAQFAPHEDFPNYPRNEERDWHKLTSGPADAMYAPGVDEIYPHDFATRVEVAGITQTLEGVSRPHFFSGVTTVVSKLFLQCVPDAAIFGEKDYQQLLVVRRLVRDMSFPITIIAAPTAREPDGIAMSSRNVYLDAEDRQIAPQLHIVLKDMAHDLAGGREIAETVRQGWARLENAGFRLDYLDVRHSDTLLPLEDTVEEPARLLAAAYLGQTRLIDNVQVLPERR